MSTDHRTPKIDEASTTPTIVKPAKGFTVPSDHVPGQTIPSKPESKGKDVIPTTFR